MSGKTFYKTIYKFIANALLWPEQYQGCIKINLLLQLAVQVQGCKFSQVVDVFPHQLLGIDRGQFAVQRSMNHTKAKIKNIKTM